MVERKHPKDGRSLFDQASDYLEQVRFVYFRLLKCDGETQDSAFPLD